MWQPPPIRKTRPYRPHRRVVRAAELAFCFLFAAAVLAGGPSVASGFPALLGAILPTGFMAAEARGEQPASFVALHLFGLAGGNGLYRPAVLFPVTAHGFPAWLDSRARIAMHTYDGVTVIAPRVPAAIALVIDDMGNDATEDRRAIALPRAVTLSFLPYPDATPELAREAERAGHAVIVHVPMQALGDDDPGPMALRTDLAPAEIARRLQWALSRVPGYSGVNNHMGSAFTRDEAALVPVAEALADRHVFFFDSKTTPDSKVVEVAHAFGVASASRDIFLDDVQTAGAIDAQLNDLEAIARHDGIAIAIGHPHPATMDALTRWTATAQARGLTLVTLSEAIRMKTERAVALAYAR
jgi:polysaccharide deacetylase 2 family uncharacterized protein YibQ